MRTIHCYNFLFLVSFSSISMAALVQKTTRLKFLIILDDDLGYGDLSGVAFIGLDSAGKAFP